MEKRKVLIVDDDPHFSQMMEYNLKKEGYSVNCVNDGAKAVEAVSASRPDLVFMDIQMPNMDGMEALQKIKAVDGNLPVVMITGHADVDVAVKAMKSGAYDFISKPFKPEELKVTARNAMESRGLMKEVGRLRSELKTKYDFKSIIGTSQKMRALFSIIESAVGSPVTVLIQGESGTGKELVAKAIHYNSDRKNQPFVVVNCAAIPETLLESELFGYERGAFTGALERRLGKFELADKGTIFLDEIGDLAAATQAKLLRVLESKEIERLGGKERFTVDVRIISATNKELLKEVNEGRFREDLYYRLAVFPIFLPPLRERKEDIPLLISHFIEEFNKSSKKHVKHISKEAMELLVNYSWPGNVRQLENMIERGVVLCGGDTITPEYIAMEAERPVPGSNIIPKPQVFSDQGIQSLEKMESNALSKALDMVGHNVSKAAKELGIGRATFYRKAKKFGII